MEKGRPKLGFFVREPYASHIVQGKKVWEIRRYRTGIRGRVGVVSSRGLIGTVVIEEVLGPFGLEELSREQGKHLAEPAFLERYARGRPLYAWVLSDPEAFPEPIPIKRPKGPGVWIRLEGLLD